MELTKIVCPKCQHKNTNKIFKQVTVDHLEKILNQSLFKFKCRQCGYEALLDYSLQYQDDDKKIVIYYVTNPEELNEVMDLLEDETVICETKGYICRVVCSQEDLIEKINIFNSGRDDRIIEIIKVFFYKQIQNEFQVDAIRYKDNEIQFYYQNFKQGSIPFEDSLYEQVSKQYPNLKQDVRIDFDWSVEAIL